MNGVNFFDTVTDYDFSSLYVYINDKLTNIPANSLTAEAGDDIRIVSLSKPYPFFRPRDKDYIASIEEPLPFMGETNFTGYFASCESLVSIPENLFINNPQITSFYRGFYRCADLTSIPVGLFDNNPNVTTFSRCFSLCSSLTSIPIGLFDNNPNVTEFDYCFYSCSALTSIPEGLFDNNLNVTEFNYCFGGCSALTSIPVGLFDNNPEVIDFSNCFYGCEALTSIPLGLFDKNTKVTSFYSCFNFCTKLKVNVQIGSTTNGVNVNHFAIGTKEKGTVYCHAGSAAYNAFKESISANVNVLTY